MQTDTKNKVFFAVRFAVSVAFFALLFFIIRKDLGTIAFILKKTDIARYCAGLAFYCLAVVCISQRLKHSFSAQGIPVRETGALHLSLIGFFFNIFMPTAVGGDVAKIFYASKASRKFLESTSAVFVDRVLGLVTFAVIVIVAVFFVREIVIPDSVKWSLMAVSFLFIGLLVFLFEERFAHKLSFMLKPFRALGLEEKLKKLQGSFAVYKRRPRDLGAMVLFSFFAQFAAVTAIWFSSKSIYHEVNFVVLFFTLPLIALLTMLPSINGLGIRESGYVCFFGPLIGKEAAFALSMLALSQILFVSIVGGVFYLFREKLVIANEPGGIYDR